MNDTSRTLSSESIEYRMQTMDYDGETHYHIERKINDSKWKLLFGGLTYHDAKQFLDNPESIERYHKRLKTQGWIILGGIIITILYFSI